MQKFKGETDEEFERRKKRVRRTRQHSNNGLGNTLAHVGGGGGGGIVSSLCAFNAVALPGDAYVDLDIVHQLGDEQVFNPNFDGDIDGWTIRTRGTATYESEGMKLVTTAISNGYGFVVSNDNLYSPSSLVRVEIDVESFAFADPSTKLCFYNTSGAVTIPLDIQLGMNVFFIEMTGGEGKIELTTHDLSTIGDEIILNSVSIKEITTNNSYFTYTDPVTQDITTLSSDVNESTNSIKNGYFDENIDWWVSNKANQIFFDNSTLKIVSNGQNNPQVWQTVKTKVDEKFDFTLDVVSTTRVGKVFIRIGSTGSNSGDIKAFNSVNAGTFSGTFLAKSDETTVTVYVNDKTVGTIVHIDNVEIKKYLPTATTYKMENDFSNAVSHDTPFSQADLDLMKTYPLTLKKVWFNGVVLPSGFAKVNMKHFYPADEGVDGGANVHDLVTATDAVIQNYTDACRTTYQEVPCASIQPYPYSHR